MIDYVGRATTSQAQRANKSNRESTGTVAKTVAYLFPVIFTAVFILNVVFELASRS